MNDALVWFIAAEAMGLAALPLAFVLFKRLPDRGFTLAKPLALVFFSYLLWILGLTHAAPNTQITLILLLVGGAAVSAVVLRNVAREFADFVRSHWPMLAAGEVIFIAFFVMWGAIVSAAPAINHTEKPMDFAFMNAVLQSRFFPPEDPWLSGSAISYYYFGHFMMAFLTQLTGVASSVGYNLALALVPALLAGAVFGLLYNLVRLSGGSLRAGILFGAAAPALIVLAGNLEGGLEFVRSIGWGGAGFWDWVGIKGLEGAATGSGGFPNDFWWWFRASRVIDTLADGQSLDYTITEFPMFSFILGDLHPHVLSLPFMVLGLSLILNMYRSPDSLGLGWLRAHPAQSAAAALVLGSLAFVNIWDFPVTAAVFAASMLVKAYADEEGGLQRAAVNAAAVVVPILAVAVLLFLPFYLDFEAQTSGVLPLQEVSTRPFLLFVAMGLFLFPVLIFIARLLPGLPRPTQAEVPAAVAIMAVVLTPLLAWAGAAFATTLVTDGPGEAFSEIGRRSVLAVPGMAVVAAASFAAVQLAREPERRILAFMLVLAAIGFYLLVGAELFYINDSFGGAFRRMNTVFKTYYQAWLLLGAVGSYSLYHWWAFRKSSPRIWPETAWFRRAVTAGGYLAVGGVAVLSAVSFYYPVGAALDRAGLLEQDYSPNGNTLDGLDFVRTSSPGEYAAIRWLRDEAPWGRIVEAVGDDYSEYGRVSSSTGLPTVLGWKGHELQWRGSSTAFAGREEAVERIYTSEDLESVRRLLKIYGVRYVYLGHRERNSYGVSGLERFAPFLKTAFQQDGVLVYEMIGDSALQTGPERDSGRQ